MSRPLIARDLRPAAGFLAFGALVIVAYFNLPAGGRAQEYLYDPLGAVAAAATLWGIRRFRPKTPLPWILFALGNTASAVGDTLFDLFPNASTPSAADGFYLASYPLLAGALVILLVRAGGHHRVAALAEAGIATFAFALFQWVFLMEPLLSGGGGTGERVVNATYPLADIVLLAGLTGLFVSPAWRKPAFWLLLGAIVAMIVGDELYGFWADTYAAGDPIDITWMSSYVLFGVAALHPSMRELEESRRQPALRVSSWRVVLLTAALLSPATILLVQQARGAKLEIGAVFAASVLISLLVVWRLAGILRALERLRLREREARTEAVQAREQLAAQNEQLLEADRLKDEFVALVSHDLRTPLTSIIGYTELALDDSEGEPLDPERQSYLSVVARSSERLLRLVDDLLFVARLQAGKGLELEPAELDLAHVAAQAVHEALPRAQAKGLELRYSGAVSLPLAADRGRLFQLLDNLIANAVKFTPEGGTVEVHVEAGSNGAVLEVRDTGIGLAPGDAERLFERFFRSERATTAQIPGTGLGLFIAHAIIQAHGGRISARARERGGTTFRIELPASAVPRREDDEAELVA